MFQMQIEGNRNRPANSLGLFAKLKQEKQSEPHENEIFGVPVIQSDCSDDEDTHISNNINIQSIRVKLQKFKRDKAMQVVKMHKETKKSIQEIVAMMKEQFSYEALCLIDEKHKLSAEKPSRQLKDAGSTLPSSQERREEKETPGFDLQTTNGKAVNIDVDLRQFTLGQKDDPQSVETIKFFNDDDHFVTEFQANPRKSTLTIKNKIMMKRSKVDQS